MPIGSVHKSSSNVGISSDYDMAIGRFEYQAKEKAPEIVLTYGIYTRVPELIKEELKAQANENKRLKNKALRFSINFDRNDKTPEYIRRQFVDNVMQEMGIKKDNHLAVVTKHNDKHPHYHVLAIRVGLDGKTLSDSHTKRRLELAIDKWEKIMNLDNSLAKTRAFIYDENSENGYKTQKRQRLSQQNSLPKQKVPKKDFVQSEVKKALNNPQIRTVEELKQELSKQGIEFRYTTNKNGLSGTSFGYGNQSIKGSAIGYKASVIRTELEKNVKVQELPPHEKADLERIRREKLIIGSKDWEEFIIPQFKAKELQIVQQIDRIISEKGNIRIDEIDDLIRIGMKEVEPKNNPWLTARKLGGEEWEHKIHRYADEKNELQQKRKEQEQIKAHEASWKEANMRQFQLKQFHIIKSMEKIIREKGIIHIHEIDDLIRKGMKEIDPNKDPLTTAEKLGGENWRLNIHKLANEKNELQQKRKEQEQEQTQKRRGFTR